MVTGETHWETQWLPRSKGMVVWTRWSTVVGSGVVGNEVREKVTST